MPLYLTAVEVLEVADLIEVASSLVALPQVTGQEPSFAVFEVVHVQLVVEHLWSWGEKTFLQKNLTCTMLLAFSV